MGPSTDHKVFSSTDELSTDHTLDDTARTIGANTNKEVLSSKVHALELKVKELEDKIYQAETNAAQQIFRLENIKQKEELVKFYTGFPDYATLMIFKEILERDAVVMRIWKGKDCKDNFDERNVDGHVSFLCWNNFL